MLDIETFDNLRGGNVAYKALAHPLAALGLAQLTERLNAAGPGSMSKGFMCMTRWRSARSAAAMWRGR
jgi:hypothetical protein